ncbi:MAG: C10 family peptidase [Dysgonomonas sp.]|nr:C10 family peptidase [Dysgonomonas sp.]
MKKTLLIFLFAGFLFSCSSEDQSIANSDDVGTYSEFKVTKEELVANVTGFLNEFYSDNASTKSSKSKFTIKSIELLTEKDFPQELTKSSGGLEFDSLLYVVNLDEGFVIAGADKRTAPVFAIIDEGSFSKDILQSENDNDAPFLAYIDRALLIINDDIADNELYDEKLPSTKAYPIKERVYPLLGRTKWGQSRNPYILYCPKGTHAGCVIVALAQVSLYYQSPKSVYFGSNIPQNPLGKGFTLNLNWTNILNASNRNGGWMPDASFSLTEGFYNESQAVALYMRYIGEIVGANYTTDGTSASFPRAISYMRDRIGLQATDQHEFNRHNLYKQIRGGNFVVLNGCANSSGFKRTTCHMWLADGVFVSNHDHHYFHYNWGWSGEHNGFFFEDRWNPGKSEFNDDGSEKPQGDYGKNYKYGLKASYISW